MKARVWQVGMKGDTHFWVQFYMDAFSEFISPHYGPKPYRNSLPEKCGVVNIFVSAGQMMDSFITSPQNYYMKKEQSLAIEQQVLLILLPIVKINFCGSEIGPPPILLLLSQFHRLLAAIQSSINIGVEDCMSKMVTRRKGHMLRFVYLQFFCDVRYQVLSLSINLILPGKNLWWRP